MAGFNEYPYRDYSGYNLDYILSKTGNAEAALLAAEQASATARTAAQTAAAARTEAEAATQTAETAQSIAEGISDTADQALTEAAAARQAATDAGSAALSAVTTANNAVSTANAAQSSADAAGTAAAAAQTTANNAIDQAETNTGDISSINSNLANKFTSGTWTPAVMRANITAASGKWFKIGDVYFLSGDISFNSNQTNQGNIYIAEESFPLNGDYAVYGSGGASYHYVLGCTSVNKNVWVAQVDIGRIPATQAGLAGDTVRFELIAVPL